MVDDLILRMMQRTTLIAAHRILIREMMQAAGVSSYAALARRAGLAVSTIARLMNERKPTKFALSATTLAKLSAATGVAVPAGMTDSQPRGPAIEVDLPKLRLALESAGDGPESAFIAARVYAYFVRHPYLTDDQAIVVGRAIAEELRAALRDRDKLEGGADQD